MEQMGLGGNQNLTEYLRLYIALHGAHIGYVCYAESETLSGDHEGGNVSAHTARMCLWLFCCLT